MLNTRENIRVINFDAIILLTIVVFGFLIYNGTFRTSTEQTRNKHSDYATCSQNDAVFNTGIRLQIFQKTLGSNKDNFNPLAFNRNPLYDDKKTGIIITHLLMIRQNLYRIPLLFLRSHLFPVETDEQPLLS